jgi:hypothetical protein
MEAETGPAWYITYTQETICTTNDKEVCRLTDLEIILVSNYGDHVLSSGLEAGGMTKCGW